MSVRRRNLALVTAVGAMLAGGLLWRYRHHDAPAAASVRPAPGGVVSNRVAPAATAVPSPLPSAELARRQALFPSFKKRPFAAAHEDGHYAWTAADGKDPGVIRELAHNEVELERLAEENARIYRRQLIYLNQTLDQLVQDAKAAGQSVRQLVLPGLDGREIQCDISTTDLSPSGQRGTLAGRVAGDSDSMVTVAFNGGREAFTVVSAKNNLVGEPRESGEIIVKSINPETYVTGSCGNP